MNIFIFEDPTIFQSYYYWLLWLRVAYHLYKIATLVDTSAEIANLF